MQNGGNNISDAQFDSMVDMLSPEMLRMSLNFAQQNPNLVNQQMGQQQTGAGQGNATNAAAAAGAAANAG